MAHKEIKTISIRFPIALYRKINELSEKQHRSINMQVIHLCKYALRALEREQEREEEYVEKDLIEQNV